MAFYHDLITQESWEELKRLSKTIRFVLIGGWAVYLYTKALKSKDIDILTDYDQLPLLRENYSLSKNERLKKYEARKGPVEIDIYLPHFSLLGIPVEVLQKKTHLYEGFTLVTPETLLVLKLYALSQRGRTPKGRKDFLDIVSLFDAQKISGAVVRKMLKEYSLETVWENFLEHLAEHRQVEELGINRHQFARIKKRMTAEETV